MKHKSGKKIRKLKTVIFISGRGSNMASLIDACDAPQYPAEIGAVISDYASAGGLEIAASKGITTHVFERRDYSSKTDHETAILDQMAIIKPQLICLAGYMRILTEYFVARYEGRIINIHPSLLPLFKGLNTHQRALEAGEKTHGCSVHVVTAGLDDGPVIAQASVPILANDDAEILAQRVITEEHKLYPQALEKFALEKMRKLSG